VHQGGGGRLDLPLATPGRTHSVQPSEVHIPSYLCCRGDTLSVDCYSSHIGGYAAGDMTRQLSQAILKAEQLALEIYLAGQTEEKRAAFEKGEKAAE
jgi:hypothetical protein